MSKLFEMPVNINAIAAYKDRKFTKWTAIAMLFARTELFVVFTLTLLHIVWLDSI